MEIQHIENALKQSKGKVFGAGGAAERLKINAKTLSSRMAKLGINKSS
jgi:transcriptional regulator with GAF, ATPase, and Fis domain